MNFAAIAPERLPELLRAMPKAELHMHIEGSLEPEMIFSLAQRNHVFLRYPSVQALREAYAFDNLQSFLDIYYAGASVLTQPQDFYDLAWAYFQRAADDGVVHAEIFFDPQTHLPRNVTMRTMLGGLSRACDDAKTQLGISAGIIMCFLRHLSESEALDTLEAVIPWRQHIIGVGLDSSELGHPPEKFVRVFARARQMGLRAVAHAGEEGPPAYIWGALDGLRAERIDHGVQAVHDSALMQRLANDRTPLTVCPLSNLKLRVFADLSQHNLKQMLDAGLCVTLNSDDPAYFGGYLLDNYAQIFAALRLDASHAYQLARNSLEASFVDDAQKQRWHAQLDACFRRFGA